MSSLNTIDLEDIAIETMGGQAAEKTDEKTDEQSKKKSNCTPCSLILWGFMLTVVPLIPLTFVLVELPQIDYVNSLPLGKCDLKKAVLMRTSGSTFKVYNVEVVELIPNQESTFVFPIQTTMIYPSDKTFRVADPSVDDRISDLLSKEYIGCYFDQAKNVAFDSPPDIGLSTLFLIVYGVVCGIPALVLILYGLYGFMKQNCICNKSHNNRMMISSNMNYFQVPVDDTLKIQ